MFRDRAARITEQMATRYGTHPALRMWHVSNELGCHVGRCYCDVSAAAFRGWLEERYGTLDALNRAWGTNFWSQRYHRWVDIQPPRRAPTWLNPTHQLDFARFSSDEVLALYTNERDILARITPTIPVTTNFVGRPAAEYWSVADEVDVLAMDHYLDSSNPRAHVELAFTADLSRGLAGGEPWLLMEHSTSAVNWQPRNRAKLPGELIRNSLQHVGRGSDGAMFFQWRASAAGAEKYHSAMVPHAGTDTKVWRDVVALGDALGRLDEVVGSRVEASVGMVLDFENWWYHDLASHPSSAVSYIEMPHALHEVLWDAGITVDVVRPGAALDGYDLVLVPTLTLVRDRDAEVIDRFVAGGGTALVTYFSGIVDELDHVRLGGYPGAFRDLLGIVTEEFHPLQEGEVVHLDNGATATLWTEHTHKVGSKIVASYVDGPVAGSPAITRHEHGDGVAWYLGTRIDAEGLAALVREIVAECGIEPVVADLPAGVEAVRRRHEGADAASFVFVVNHTDHHIHIDLPGTDLLHDHGQVDRHHIKSGTVSVIREAT